MELAIRVFQHSKRSAGEFPCDSAETVNTPQRQLPPPSVTLAAFENIFNLATMLGSPWRLFGADKFKKRSAKMNGYHHWQRIVNRDEGRKSGIYACYTQVCLIRTLALGTIRLGYSRFHNVPVFKMSVLCWTNSVSFVVGQSNKDQLWTFGRGTPRKTRETKTHWTPHDTFQNQKQFLSSKVQKMRRRNVFYFLWNVQKAVCFVPCVYIPWGTHKQYLIWILFLFPEAAKHSYIRKLIIPLRRIILPLGDTRRKNTAQASCLAFYNPGWYRINVCELYLN